MTLNTAAPRPTPSLLQFFASCLAVLCGSVLLTLSTSNSANIVSKAGNLPAKTEVDGPGIFRYSRTKTSLWPRREPKQLSMRKTHACPRKGFLQRLEKQDAVVSPSALGTPVPAPSLWSITPTIERPQLALMLHLQHIVQGQTTGINHCSFTVVSSFSSSKVSFRHWRQRR